MSRVHASYILPRLIIMGTRGHLHTSSFISGHGSMFNECGYKAFDIYMCVYAYMCVRKVGLC